MAGGLDDTGGPLFAAAVLVSAASTAQAASDKKCQGTPENFQVVNGRCVSDGKAEHL